MVACINYFKNDTRVHLDDKAPDASEIWTRPLCFELTLLHLLERQRNGQSYMQQETNCMELVEHVLFFFFSFFASKS